MDKLSAGLVALTQCQRGDGLLLLIVDQTAIGDIQILAGNYPAERRAIPLI
ncbi:MAG: hypothetical protein U9O41_02700 [Candidatus Aerophobetes bacterium]|nr:hypothetical protein [Candidatus Aerophobetes bacterium]